ncbi:MAG: tetratricopeptide repeat protein [Saprospiraceae bacterium]
MAKAQDPNLALQYFTDGEYSKAAALYEKLWEAQPGVEMYFDKLIESNAALEQFEKCEAIIKKEIKKKPKDLHLLVALGNIYAKKGEDKAANESYEKAVDKLTPELYYITRLAQVFSNLGKFDYAIKTYEKGGELLKSKSQFAFYLGDLYRNKGDQVPKMIENYLLSLESNAGYLGTLQYYFQRYLSEEDHKELQSQLYTLLQEQPDNVAYSDLLVWTFTNRKDYKNALRQAKALEKLVGNKGDKVNAIALAAEQDKDYDAAIAGYDFLVNEIPKEGNRYYYEAKRKSLYCKNRKVVERQDYSREDLLALEAEYEKFLTENEKSKLTSEIIAQLAELEAFYLKNLPKAISLLQEMIAYPGLSPNVMANAKINLGDFSLMNGDRWEATLLYSQVDKQFKDDILGHEARFRNAKLSYFTGDFEWAQSQFDVLKASTSKLISNDALDLSVFLMDNTGLDTTTTAMQMYATAELLTFQNRFEEAFSKLDSISVLFPDHTLTDDILWTKGQIYLKQREWTKAETVFTKIVDTFKEEIRADNALFALAKLNDEHLNNKEKAKTLYEKLFMEYSSSIFAVDARKEFRRLRGDKIN